MDIFSGLQLCLIGIITLLFAYNYLIKKPWRNLPPGPPALPLVGSLPFMGTDNRKALMDMADKYGNVFMIHLGLMPAVVLHGYDTIREAIVQKSHAFSARANSMIVWETYSKGYGIVFNHNHWQEQRHHALQLFRQFGLGKRAFEERILQEISSCVEELDKQAGKPFHPESILHKSSMNTICSVVFGKRFEYDDAVFSKCIDIVKYSFEVGQASGILNILPFIQHLPGDLLGLKRLEHEMKNMHQEHQKIIDQHKMKLDMDSSPADIIDAYLKKIATESKNPESSFTERQLLGVIADLYLAGAETVATTLEWAIIFMTLNPAIQSRVQAEIDDVICGDEAASIVHRGNLPFTEACILEVQRTGDVIPLIFRRTTTEVDFKGYTIPKDMTILANLTSANMDPKRWPNPDKFDPCRFIGEQGTVTGSDEILPFGLGKRECLGIELAKMELFLYFTSIMKRFNFRQAPGYPAPDTRGIVGASRHPKPYHIIMERR